MYIVMQLYFVLGARMLYKNLPKAVGLRRVTLHKSLNPSDGKDTVYLLLVECSHFMDHVGEAANLLPILRGRICGYTGIYRVADSFWQQPSHTGRDNLEQIYDTDNRGLPHNSFQSPTYQRHQKKENEYDENVFSVCNSPTSPLSLPDNQHFTIEEEKDKLPRSKSVTNEEKSSGRGFFASLFNLW